jgi:hypothetical protein
MEEWLPEIQAWCLKNKHLVAKCYSFTNENNIIGVTAIIDSEMCKVDIYNNGVRGELSEIADKYKLLHACSYDVWGSGWMDTKKFNTYHIDAKVVYDNRTREYLEKLEQSGNND